MPFCTSCGTQIAAGNRFCPNCGTPAAGVPVVAPVVAEPLQYSIHGDNLQVARIRLRPGQEVYAEAGKMVYKHSCIEWESRMTGDTLGAKIWGAVKRKLMGESLFLTYFRALTPGEVGFAGNYPGRIQVFDLAPGQSVLVQRDSFICAQSTVQLNLAFVKKLGAGLFGGEGFILERLAGGIKTAIFGGEGLFLATLTGPGRLIVQSMTLEKLRRELAPTRTGGDEHGPLGALGGIFRSED